MWNTLEFTESACWRHEEAAVIYLLLLLWLLLSCCSLTHPQGSYHFALGNINMALASTNTGHVLCSSAVPSAWNFPSSVFQANCYLPFTIWIRHQLLQETLPNSLFLGGLVLCIHSLMPQALTEHLECTSHCARCTGTVMKRKVASCPQGS